MTHIETPLEDACSDLACALRYGDITDQSTREWVAHAHQILKDYTRAGNLSPSYLLAQDRARREEKSHV